jgi:hypothetical protein
VDGPIASTSASRDVRSSPAKPARPTLEKVFPVASSPGPRGFDSSSASKSSTRKGKRFADVTPKSSTAAPPKPGYSYAGLIGQAILAHPQRRISLADIYAFIMQRYPYYRKEDAGWQNSIRHNLSLNDCFVKTARTDQDEPGKGMLWTIKDGSDDCFEGGGFRKLSKSSKAKRSAKGKMRDDDDCGRPESMGPMSSTSTSARPNFNRTFSKRPLSQDPFDDSESEVEVELSVAKKQKSQHQLDEEAFDDEINDPCPQPPSPPSLGENDRGSSPPRMPASSDAALTSPLHSATSRARAREVFTSQPPRPSLPSPIIVSSPPSNVFARLAQPYHSLPTTLRAANEALMSSPPVSGILPVDPISYRNSGGSPTLQPALFPTSLKSSRPEPSYQPHVLMSPSSLVNIHTQSPISSIRETSKTCRADDEDRPNDENEDTTMTGTAKGQGGSNNNNFSAPGPAAARFRALSPVLKTPTRGLPHPRSPMKPGLGGASSLSSSSASSSKTLQAVLAAATPKRGGASGHNNSGYFFGTPGANPSPGALIDSYDFEESSPSAGNGVARQLWFQSPGRGW